MGKKDKRPAPQQEKTRKGWGEKRVRVPRIIKQKCVGCGSVVGHDEVDMEGRCGFCK